MMKCPAGVPRSIVSALLLALFLSLSMTGFASASSSTPLDVTRCLTAAPATQTVVVNQLAKVQITVNCIPKTLTASVDVAWGDNTTSQYPLCIDACPAPPLVINATHTYTALGDFHPNICLVPSPLGSVPDCVQVEILVIPLA